MTERSFRREEDEAGNVRLVAEGCTFIYRRPAQGVVHIQIVGHDRGQFGTAVIEELSPDLAAFAPVELFFDTAEVFMAVTSVSELWTKWISNNRASLKNVNILVRSKFVQLTVEVAKLFSRTGNLIRVYLDPDHFEAALKTSLARGRPARA